MENLRRIVTGHNKNGKSIVMIDGKPSRTIGEDVGGLFEVWNTCLLYTSPSPRD